MGLFKNEKYPEAEKLARRGFYVPSGLATSNEQIKIVSDKLISILNNL
jgi:perosamine synthetase